MQRVELGWPLVSHVANQGKVYLRHGKKSKSSDWCRLLAFITCVARSASPARVPGDVFFSLLQIEQRKASRDAGRSAGGLGLP